MHSYSPLPLTIIQIITPNDYYFFLSGKSVFFLFFTFKNYQYILDITPYQYVENFLIPFYS